MSRGWVPAACAAVLLGAAGCEQLPGRPQPAGRYVRPAEVLEFAALYGQNCAGCHGDEARPGAALALSDPVYLAIAGDEVIRRATAFGVAGTAMPAFARRAGGPLTNAQIDVLVRGLRRRWSKPGTVAAAGSPPYAAPPGDAARGRDAYAVYCASCHGRDGKGGRRGGSVVDGAYLALVSDQGLRTTVIAGRPALGMPDFRSYVPGRPMSAGEIADVVAWLAAQRPEYSGQPYAVPEGPLSGAVGEAPPRGGMQP